MHVSPWSPCTFPPDSRREVLEALTATPRPDGPLYIAGDVNLQLHAPRDGAEYEDSQQPEALLASCARRVTRRGQHTTPSIDIIAVIALFTCVLSATSPTSRIVRAVRLVAVATEINLLSKADVRASVVFAICHVIVDIFSEPVRRRGILKGITRALRRLCAPITLLEGVLS